MKKALALILSLMMIMSVCSVSAAFVEDPDVTTGVLLSDDFESWTKPIDARRTPSGAGEGGHGPYSSCGGAWPLVVDGDKVWASQANDAGQSLWYAHNRAGAADIDNGKLSISFQVEVVSGYEGVDSFEGNYPSIYIGIWSSAGTVSMASIANTSDSRNGGGAINFGTYTVNTEQVESGTAVIFDADVEHKFEAVIDYDAAKTIFYLDDEKIGEVEQALKLKVGNEFGLLTGGKTTDASFPADGNGLKPYIYVDDLKLERIGGAEPEEPGYVYVPSDELEAPVELLNEDFTDETAPNSNWENHNATVADGVMSIASGGWPCVLFPNTVTTTDVYELSYKIKSSSTAGTAKNYIYNSGANNMHTGAYKPGVGFGAAYDMGTMTYLNDDNTQWYTVKVEWCYDAANTYAYYSIYDEEGTKLYDKLATTIVGPEGKPIASPIPVPKKVMFWNEGMSEYLLDDVVLRQLPVGYNPKVYQPQVWTQVGGTGAYELVGADTVIANGDVLTAEAYAAPGNQLILAAYNSEGELMAAKVDTVAIRDFYQVIAAATEDGFAGAAYVKAFLLGTGTGFKPITVCYDSSAK